VKQCKQNVASAESTVTHQFSESSRHPQRLLIEEVDESGKSYPVDYHHRRFIILDDEKKWLSYDGAWRSR